MVLDFKFIIAGIFIIACLIPLYIYRERIFKRFYKKGDINHFIKNLDSYLRVKYPKINFNFSKLKKLVENEKDIRIQEVLIVENLVQQFAYYDYELNTQKSIPSDKLWSSYMANSKLLKDNKLPLDWQQRKKAAWLRDNNQCNRCGTKISLMDSHALLAKQMKNGGGFNLENIVILCNDCTRIIKSSNIERTKKDLNILDQLMEKATK